MRKMRMAYVLTGAVLASLLFFAVRYAITDQREKAIAADYGQAYVRAAYGRQDELTVTGRCHPMFGSGAHEVTIRDAEDNPYYMYVMLGPNGSLTRIEDMTKDVRRGRSQFGCGIEQVKGVVTPDILRLDPDQVTRVQFGEANNASAPVVFEAKTAAGRATIDRLLGWYDDAEYEGPSPDSQLGIRTMGYPSLRIFIQGDDSSVLVNLVNGKLNVMHDSLEAPLSIVSEELAGWMVEGWKAEDF